jgi:hypothetical protein
MAGLCQEFVPGIRRGGLCPYEENGKNEDKNSDAT